jgi:hypothetical protein
MAGMRLSFACGLYDRMLPLYTGEVQAEGIDLDYVAIDSPRDIFDRMAGGLEFDVAEISSSVHQPRSAGNVPSSPSGISIEIHRHQPRIRDKDAQGSGRQADRSATVHDDRRNMD